MHKKIKELVLNNIKDVVLRPTSYNKKFISDRFNSYFIGVEDAKTFYMITISTDSKKKKETTFFKLNRSYNIVGETYKYKIHN